MREPAASQIIAGKYRIESLIGHGGMGSVWRAQHVTLGMPVAVKFMGEHAMSDPESRKRFDREARALASLRTPHIVQVLDHGVDDDTPYIVMELLEGEDLSTRLQRERRLSLPDTSFLLGQAARALRRAHEAGITHRDLKPSNIFLARIDDEIVVKVLDFGVAKLAAAGVLDGQSQLTRTGTLLGSPGYMSPEQARGKEVDFRSDLWALAVIVFRCVTGVKPFAGDSIAELVIKLCIDPRPVATRLAPDLPPAVDRFFEKAFAASPEDRYQSAVEMASAFAQVIGQRLELSRTGPSPVAGVSRAVLDQPALPPPASASSVAAGPLPAPSASPLPALPRPNPPPGGPSAASSPQAASAFAFPPAPPLGSAASPAGSQPSSPAWTGSPAAPASPLPVFGSPALPPPNAPPRAPDPSSVPPHREPTPTPASFGGFAPSVLEAASAPPAPDPSATPLPAGALGSPPVGALAGAVRAPDAPTPSGVHPPEAAMSRVPTPPPGSRPEGAAPGPHDSASPSGVASGDRSGASSARPASPADPERKPHGAPSTRRSFDPKVVLFAVAGAAVLAIFFFMAISGLRRRHASSGSRELDDADRGVASRPFPTEPAAPSGSAAPDPGAPSAPTADPAAPTTSSTADPAPSTDPSAAASTADPAAGTAPLGGPTVVEAPVAADPTAAPAPTAPRTGTTARPPTPGPKPTSSAKKKGTKPNFGY